MTKVGKRQSLPASPEYAGGLTESEPFIKHFTLGKELVRMRPALLERGFRFEVKKVNSLTCKIFLK